MTFITDAALDHLRDVAVWPEFTHERYLVREELGRGGMGVVYAATDTALERDVALKVGATAARDGTTVAARADAGRGVTLADRLTQEARVLARLEHPGIVPVHDYGVLADGRPFYVMKRVDGRTLASLLDTPLPLGDRLRIFERVAEAVAFAHAAGVIHRDLKPSNVMVGSFGEVMVMDFGAALVGGANADAHVVIGTRGFMAPEQEDGAGNVDARTDVFALGGMLDALLPGDAPRALRSITARARQARPADRYQTVMELAEDVRRFSAGDRVLAHRESAGERIARLGRRYQVPILLVLAYLVMRALIALTAGV